MPAAAIGFLFLIAIIITVLTSAIFWIIAGITAIMLAAI